MHSFIDYYFQSSHHEIYFKSHNDSNQVLNLVFLSVVFPLLPPWQYHGQSWRGTEVLKENCPSRSHEQMRAGQFDCFDLVVLEVGLGRACPRAVCVCVRFKCRSFKILPLKRAAFPRHCWSLQPLPSGGCSTALSPSEIILPVTSTLWSRIPDLCPCVCFLQASGERVNLTIARPGKPQPGNTVREAAPPSQQHPQPLYYSRPSAHKVRRSVCAVIHPPRRIVTVSWYNLNEHYYSVGEGEHGSLGCKLRMFCCLGEWCIVWAPQPMEVVS